MDTQQLERMHTAPGFVAALDQSGGSTPKALRAYGIEESAYGDDKDRMFDLVHEMRTRIITSPSFDGDRILGAILFAISVVGIFLNRKNVIVILMAVELILLAVNLNLVAFSAFLQDLTGQIFAMLVLTVAAAEAAIGLAILVIYFRTRGSIAVDDINRMKG